MKVRKGKLLKFIGGFLFSTTFFTAVENMNFYTISHSTTAPRHKFPCLPN